jgi:hypothetical protein
LDEHVAGSLSLEVKLIFKHLTANQNRFENEMEEKKIKDNA